MIKNKICNPKCLFLNPTEFQQDLWKKYQEKRIIRLVGHWCMKFQIKLLHGGYHPEILKCDLCYNEFFDEFKKLKKEAGGDG